MEWHDGNGNHQVMALVLLESLYGPYDLMKSNTL
jgi:hypothetical protein